MVVRTGKKMPIPQKKTNTHLNSVLFKSNFQLDFFFCNLISLSDFSVSSTLLDFWLTQVYSSTTFPANSVFQASI